MKGREKIKDKRKMRRVCGGMSKEEDKECRKERIINGEKSDSEKEERKKYIMCGERESDRG